MSVTRWHGVCYACKGERDVESRSSHAMKVLCDDCAARPHRRPVAYDADFIEPQVSRNGAKVAPVAKAAAVKLRVLDVEFMLATEPPPVPYVVKPLLVAGCVTMLAGREGQGKSMFALGTGSAIGHGATVAGLDCEPGRVLYVDAENGEREAHRRVRGLCVKPGSLVYVEAQTFNLTADIALLESLVDEHKPSVVVLDSLRSLAPGLDENDSKQAEAAVRPTSRLAQKHGIPVLLLHHAGKGGHEYRGSTAIGAAVELGFTLSRHEDDPDKRTRRKLACWKCRPAPEPDELWISMASVDGLITLTETEPYRGERHRDRDDLRDDVLGVLDGERMTGASIAKALGRDKTDGTVRRILRDLEADGVIDRDGGLWGVATATVAIRVGNPGNPPEIPVVEPNQGLPLDLATGTAGNPQTGHVDDYAERYQRRQIEGAWGASAAGDERCERCDGLLGYDTDAQETRCVNGHRQEPRP